MEQKTNYWMIATFILISLIVGFGVAQLPVFQRESSGSGKSVEQKVSSGTQEQKQPTDEDYRKIAKLVYDDKDPVIGNPNAPVTIVEFSDFQCPFCAAAAGVPNVVAENLKGRDSTWEPFVPKLLKTYVAQGKVRFIYRDFPLPNHPQAEEAALAAECSHEQGKFFEMHDKIFFGADQWIGDDEKAKTEFKKYAKELSLDAKQFNECFDSVKYRDEIQKDYQAGISAAVSGTPTFYVNGRELGGAQSFSEIAKVIDSLLP